VRCRKCGAKMTLTKNTSQSAPECQLSKSGTPESMKILLNSTQTLSDEELCALEEDLNYYSETGLIGVTMSRLLVLLQTNGSAAAA